MNQQNMRYVVASKTKLRDVFIKFQVSMTKSLSLDTFIFKKRMLGWACSSLVKHVPGMCEALVLTSSTKKKKKKRQQLSKTPQKREPKSLMDFCSSLYLLILIIFISQSLSILLALSQALRLLSKNQQTKNYINFYYNTTICLTILCNMVLLLHNKNFVFH